MFTTFYMLSAKVYLMNVFIFDNFSFCWDQWCEKRIQLGVIRAMASI